MVKPQISYLAPIGLLAGLYLIYQIVMRYGLMPALIFSLLPMLMIIGGKVMQKQNIFYCYLILNYFIMGISRYIPIKSGMTMLAFSGLLIFALVIYSVFEKLDWERTNNFLTWSWAIWVLYCFLQLFNPLALWEPWTIAFPNYALYPFLCSIVVPLLFTKYRNFQYFMIIWAILTLLAAAKGYWQKNHGFDSTEYHWLFFEGGGKTHLIHSGIRFFSFFSDAAAFGASMGVSMVFFGISSLYPCKRWVKILFIAATIAGAYGMSISGTRSALIIPLAGIMVYLILCRNLKRLAISFLFLIGAYIFLSQTTIGNSNRIIRRMRTVFDKEDASWMVRVNNKKIIVDEMQGKPIGVGLGLAGAKAARYRPVSERNPLTYVATDSWFVMTYIETGIIGLIIYLGVLISILLKGAWISSFSITNRQLQGQLYAIIAAISGLLVCCYANEVLNYPNGIITYTLMAFLFIAPYYDRELQNNESKS